MCGRYYIEISDAVLREICEEIKRSWQKKESDRQLEITFDGEVFPRNVAPVQTGPGLFEPMQWGFSGFSGTRPVINARSETALEKTMFRHAMRESRCLIPASGYFEWKKEGSRKIKHRLYVPGQPLFFAGCYRKEQDSDLARFVILTRAASAELAPIHERMPVIIPSNYATAWLHESPDVMEKALTKLAFEAM